MWLYVPSPSAPESAGSTWDSEALARLAQSATSSGKHSAPRVWSTRCKRASWIKLLSGVTYEPSTLERGVEAWISSLADTRASRSARQGCDAEPPTLGTSGPKSCASTARAEPATCSARTCSDTFRLGSPLSLPTLPKWGRMSNGACSPRPTLGRRIAGSGSSSWPTPNLPNGGRSMPVETTRTGKTPDGRKVQVGLENAAKLWPTPTSLSFDTSHQPGNNRNQNKTMDLASKMWPTPVHSEARQGFQDRSTGKKGTQESLSTIAVKNSASLLAPTTAKALWSTPRASDGEKGGPNMSFGAGGTPLPAQASLFLPALTTSMAGENGSQPEDRSPSSSHERQLPMIWRHSSVTLCAALRRGLTEGHDASTQRERLLRLSELHSKRALNPTFVEALMNFPAGWTAFAPSATPSSPKSRRSRLQSSGAVPVEREA